MFLLVHRDTPAFGPFVCIACMLIPFFHLPYCTARYTHMVGVCGFEISNI